MISRTAVSLKASAPCVKKSESQSCGTGSCVTMHKGVSLCLCVFLDSCLLAQELQASISSFEWISSNVRQRLWQWSETQFSRSVMSNSLELLEPHGLQHARPPCPSPTPGAYSNSCPLSQWCHSTISSSVGPFSSHLQSCPASESFQMSQFFASSGQSTGALALASFLPKKSQGWSPSEWTGWISLQSKGLSRVFSSTTVQKQQFFGAQLSLQSNSHIHTWLLEKP